MDEHEGRKSPPSAPREGRHPERAERLAAALRANLRRRKAQARGRADPAEAADGSRPNQPSSDNDDG